MIAPVGKHNTILFIDPSPERESPIQEVLLNHGYEVHRCSAPDPSVHELRKSSIDLIIIDTTVPDFDWLKICQTFKAQTRKYDEYIPLVLLMDPATLLRFKPCLDCGADEFLLKPSSVQLQSGFPDKQPEHGCSDAPAFMELILRIQVLLRLREQQVMLHREHQQLTRIYRAMRREMREVWKVQCSFLRKVFPAHPQLSMAARYQPSALVGGDYYDVLVLDEEHWGLLIADISGHGVSAAVVMTMTQMIVREFAPGHLSPGDSLHLFDRKLSQHLHSDHFITAFYGVLNIRTFTLRYTAAGHVAPLFYSHARQQAKALALVPAYPLRTFTNEKYVEQSIQIEPGDRLLFYTDGVVDLQNPSGHLYGGEKLMHLLEKHHPLECEELLERIIEETEQFRGARERMDDFTLMLLTRKP